MRSFVPRCRVVRMEQFYNLIGSDMKAVDAVIRQRLHSEVVLVRQVAEYIVQSGGKRLRPALVLLSAGALAIAAAIITNWRR
jgi:octaprenyl-diphosphate synthase